MGIKHASHGTPLEDYELTRGDHTWQQTAETICEVAAARQRQWAAEEAADPALFEAHLAKVQWFWDFANANKPAPFELMRWRVRLYCGHIVETTRHITAASPVDAGSKIATCMECDSRQVVIVAWEPIGLAGPRPATGYSSS